MAAPSRVLLYEGIAAFLAYSAATLYYLRPLAALWRDHLAPDLGDPLFNLYVLKWGMHQLTLGMPAPWDANFFYPLQHSLALSDHLFGLAALGLPVAALTGSAVAAYNFLFLLAFALSGTTTYLVLRAGGSSRVAAAVGGSVFAFVPYRWEQASHLQILFAPWVPVVLWSFDRLLADPRPRRAAFFLAFYGLQVSGGNYLAYMVHFPLLVLLLNRLLAKPSRDRLRRPRALVTLAVTGASALSMLLAIFLPYLEMSRRLGLERGAAEYRLFGASLVAYLTPARATGYFPLVGPTLRNLMPRFEDTNWFAEKTLFPGVIPVLLMIVALVALWRRHPPRPAAAVTAARRWTVRLIAVTAAVVFLLADLYSLGFVEAPAELRDHAGIVYSFLGLALVVLFAAWALLRWRWRMGAPLDLATLPAWPRGLLFATACTVLLAFPVIFTPAAELVPGLAGMRVPARFFVFTTFGIAFLAAAGTDRLLAWRPRFRLTRRAGTGALGALLLCALLLESAPRPLDWNPVPLEPDFPPAYHWLEQHRNEVGAVLELPFLDEPDSVWYMYYSTLHWRPIVNGYSAHIPPFYRDLRRTCCSVKPPATLLQGLRSIGVTHVIIHSTDPSYRKWLAKVARGRVAGVEQVYASPSATILSLSRIP